eukprot:jgi/Botrbrau1/5032/Bobra.0396s0045.1
MAAMIQVTPAGASRPLQVSRAALNSLIRSIRQRQSTQTRPVSTGAAPRQRLNSRAARPPEAIADVEEEEEITEKDIDIADLGKDAAADAPAPEAKMALKEEKEETEKAVEAVYALSFLWLEKNVAVAVDQIFMKDARAPISEFFFWPRKDAWEELKAFLETKPWITERDKVLLLNKTTEVINFWQGENGVRPPLNDALEKFPDCAFLGA